jgi:hypothetical protein
MQVMKLQQTPRLKKTNPHQVFLQISFCVSLMTALILNSTDSFAQLIAEETNNKNEKILFHPFFKIPYLLKETKQEALLILNQKVKRIETKDLPISTNPELVNRLFNEPSHITTPSDKHNQELITFFTQKHLGKHFNEQSEHMYENLIAGWNKMITENHLLLIYSECWENNAPFELVFLALAEDYWKQGSESKKGAAGPWQITIDTAKDLGLINGHDNRNDYELSTKVAIKYLRFLYKQTFRWDNDLTDKERAKITWSDRWLYAMVSYNIGLGNVKANFIKFKGKFDPYAQHKKAFSQENSDFVAKIFGIRRALKTWYENGKMTKDGKLIIKIEQ